MRLGAFPNPSFIHRRHYTDFSSIKQDLLSRPPNIIKDVLAPGNSRDLLQTLYKILPVSPLAPPYSFKGRREPRHRYFFPQGHHLVYFPPSPSKLLPDGTDTLHYPGPPFVRRMWAGGSVSFNNMDPLYTSLRHENRPATCIESIHNVEVKHRPKEKKIFVDVERHITNALSIAKYKQPENSFSVLEKRTLVFLEARNEDDNFNNMATLRFVRPPLDPDFEMPFIPRPSLLSTFSTLSSNHHLIHLSSKYASKVEGYADMLVHGPLTLVLMLSLLRSRLEKTQMISTMYYSNLAPLYVNQMMKVCGKSRSDGTYTMWIEDSRGSLAVKGHASITTIEEIAVQELPLFQSSISIDTITKETTEKSVRKPKSMIDPTKTRHTESSDEKSEVVSMARKASKLDASQKPISKGTESKGTESSDEKPEAVSLARKAYELDPTRKPTSKVGPIKIRYFEVGDKKSETLSLAWKAYELDPTRKPRKLTSKIGPIKIRDAESSDEKSETASVARKACKLNPTRKPTSKVGPIQIRYFEVGGKKTEALSLAWKAQKSNMSPVPETPRPVAKMDRLARARKAIQDLAISRAQRLFQAQGSKQALAISQPQKKPEIIQSETAAQRPRILVPRKLRIRRRLSKQLSTATLRYHATMSHRSYLSAKRMRLIQTLFDRRIKIVDRDRDSSPLKSKYTWWKNFKNKNPDLMRLATFRSDPTAGWREVNMDAWIRKWRVTLWENRLRVSNRLLTRAFKMEEDNRTRKENLKLIGELSEIFKAKADGDKGDEGVKVEDGAKDDNGAISKDDAAKGPKISEHETIQ